jgi:2-polyprenyl-3-methyl-5-hydroxy-6-metoxy-1,4-benzoquinol methylase
MLHHAQSLCLSCGLVIAQPRATGEEIARYYRDEYYREHWPNATEAAADNRAFYSRHEVPLMRALWRDWPPPAGGRIYEAGCGYGAYLALMREQGYAVSGSDPSADAVAFCRDQRLDVTQGTIPGVQLDVPADVVVAQHVIEHVEDPRAFVRGLAALGRPGGLVALVTEDSWSAQWGLSLWGSRLTGRVPPFHTSTDHTYVFRAEHLARLLREAGCDQVRTRSFSYVAEGESLHWRLYKTTLRTIDRLTGHGDFLMAVGRLATKSTKP